MKKILLFASALAGLFLAGSCQRENLEPMESANTVTYTVQVPGALSTKTIGENVAAVTELVYEVYRTEATSADDFTQAETLLFHKTATITNGTATVEFELVNNQNFRVLFWAQVPGNGVYNVGSLKNVKISQALNANAENYAAFAGADYIKAGESIVGRTIQLVRPIAQLNIGTDDASLSIEGQTTVTIATTAVTVNGLSTSFNVAENKAGDISADDYVYAAKPLVQTSEYPGLSESTFAVNGTNYNYVAMNYVGFAPQMGTNVEVTYTINTENVGTITNTIDNVPVKANHRTNIVGNLITSMSDYTITLDAEWGETEYVGPEFVEQPAYDADTHTWTVTNADQLAWVAASVNGTIGLQTKAGAAPKTFKGETVVLANDIDLQGVEWEPIGATTTAYFQGTFDGDNHAISNFKVTEKAGHAGLFGYARATIKNLKVNNVTLKANHYAGAIVGQGYCHIDNCDAENINIIVTIDPAADGGKGDYGDKAGAIIGQNCEGSLSVTKCTAKNVIIEGYRDLGGIMGMAHDRNIVTGNSVENVTIIQNLEGAYKTEVPTTLGAIAGRWGSNVTAENNSGDANIKTAVASGVYASKTGTDSEGNTTVTEYSVYAAEGLEWVSSQVDEGCTFENVTIQLSNDLDLSNDNWDPIGDNSIDDAAFSGTFDGNGHTIKGAHITGDHCFNGAVYGSKEGWGLFSVTDGATIKNLKVDGATFASYTVISGTIAGYANNTTFENIEISNTKISGYNWYTGGVVGLAQGECTFKGVNLDETVAVGTLWDSHGQNAGGIAGGVSKDAKITIEDCNIACVLDVINDVTSNYKWYIYRVAGMIIGNTNTTETKYNEVVTATATNVTCKNVTVTYGDWMNYHYCQGYWNRGWGRYESSDYVGGVDQYEPHNHPDGESHYVCIPFDQLFGGSSNGSGHYPVKGLRKFEGVSVHYPSSYVYVEEVVSADEVTEITGGTTTGVIDEGYQINMTDDVTASATDTDANSGYGATGVKVNGGVLDGQGNTLTITDANGTWDCAVNVSGGTIKNLTVAGAMRGIFMGGANADVYIDNVIFEDVIYTFNSDGGNKNYGVYISNSTVKGWTSHSDVHKEVVYTNCTFTVGNGYAKCRPYGPTTYRNCDFDVANGSHVEAKGNVVFENCTLNGAALTTENLSTLVTSNIANATVK